MDDWMEKRMDKIRMTGWLDKFLRHGWVDDCLKAGMTGWVDGKKDG